MQAIKNFRSYFFRGLAALLPTILTIWIFVQFYVLVQTHVSSHINRGIVHILVATVDWYPAVTPEDRLAFARHAEPELSADPAALAKRADEDDIVRGARLQKGEKYWVDGPGHITGFIFALLGVCFIGAFLASVMGKTLWRFVEKALMNVPLIKKVYPYIKQITDFLLTKKQLSFSKVVAIQYPRKGTWSVGMVTGTGLKRVTREIGKDFITVFVPTSPTPFTGYVILTPKEDTIELEMTIEEALRFTISGGVITPAEHDAFKSLPSEDAVEDV
ncbi:MAG: DUF502 domain-containing protein [Anaerohalosphaera sp.]|nr:DUF502 domain-containing protein [Anaerohalosphaera sp.]